MTRNLFSRRDFLKTVGIGAGATVLAACSTPQSTQAPAATDKSVEPTKAPPSSGPITIQVLWTNWGENYNNLMKDIGTEYTKSNPNVKVEWTFDKEWMTKLLTQVASGTPPDTTYSNLDSQAALAEKKTFLQMDDLFKGAGLKVEDFVAAMYIGCQWEGKLFSLPGAVDWPAMVYSKDVYKAAGLDPEKPPATFDELIAHSTKMLKYDNDGNISLMGFTGGANNYFHFVYVKQGRFWDANAKKVTADEPVNLAVMKSFADYIKTVDANKLAAFNARPGTYEAGSAFATKQSAYQIDGFWVYDVLDKYAPDLDYAVAPLPTDTGAKEEMKRYYLSGWMLGIPVGSKQADATWKFLKYGFVDEAAKMGYQTLNGPAYLPTYPDFIAGMTKILGANNRMSKYLKVFTDAAVGTNTWPVMRVNAFYRSEEERIYDFIMRGEKTPEQGLAEINKNVQAEFDKGA